MNLKHLILLAAILCSNRLFSQEENEELIQFSGVVVSIDSLNPVPFSTVLVKNTSRGTSSDYYGYFSLVTKRGDTIQFSSVGYKTSYFVVADSLPPGRYSLIHSLQPDTIDIDLVEVFPWPTPEQFKEAFLMLDIPDDDLEIARKNLDPQILAERSANMPMGGSLNFKWKMQQRTNQLYYAGQYRPNNLLNPLAWAKFIQAWKRGDFKRK